MFTDEDGKPHSVGDQPAATYDDGTQIWMKHGVLHRDNGPALIAADKTELFFNNGKLIK